MFLGQTERVVKSIADSYDFEKVSDLTKEQFVEILSKSIYESITSRDFIKEINKQLGEEMNRSLRSRGMR